MRRRLEFCYQISDERLLAWAQRPTIERLQMLVQVRERLVLNLPGSLPDELGIRQKPPSFAVASTKRVAQLAQNDLQTGCAQGFVRRREKLVVRAADVVGFDTRAGFVQCVTLAGWV